MNNKKKNFLTISFLLVLAVLLRFILSFLPGFTADMNTWFAWANRLVDLGFSKFYNPNVWTHYTPGYLYVLWILGIIKKIFHISDQALLLQLFKLPNNLADILTALLIYKIVAKKSAHWAFLGLIFYLFNPALIFNSSVWGQADSFLTFLMLGSFYLLLEKEKIFLSALVFGFAFLVKPQALFILPIFALFLFKKYKLSGLFKFFSTFLLISLILSLPFFPGDPIFGLPNLIIQMGKDYPYTTLEAFNLWQFLGGRQNDSLLFLGLSKYHWGLLIYLLLEGIIISFILFGKKSKKENYYLITALSLFNFFLFPTRIHERYLLSFFPFLLIAGSLLSSLILIFSYFIMEILHFINIFYSYSYFYPELIKISVARINNLPKVVSFLSIMLFFGLLIFYLRRFLKKKR